MLGPCPQQSATSTLLCAAIVVMIFIFRGYILAATLEVKAFTEHARRCLGNLLCGGLGDSTTSVGREIWILLAQILSWLLLLILSLEDSTLCKNSSKIVMYLQESLSLRMALKKGKPTVCAGL